MRTGQDAAADASSAAVEVAVRRAGRAAASFGVTEIREELAELPGARPLSVPQLRRHLRALTGTVLELLPVGVAVVAEPEECTTAVRKTRGSRYRLMGALASPIDTATLDDTSRTLLALYIASGVAGVPFVPTVLVTRVLSAEPRLRLVSSQQTATVLMRLARRYPLLVSMERGPGRTQRWGATGVLQPAWAEWVAARAEALEGPLARHRQIAQAGASSAAEAVSRLVALAEQRVRDAQWPHGRPVSARRIADEVQLARAASAPSEADATLVAFADIVMPRPGALTEALHSACKMQFGHGGHRRTPLLHRLRMHDESATCYASPALKPEVIALWPQWRLAQAAASRAPLARLEREREITRGLRLTRDPLLTAIATTRTVLAVEALGALQAHVDALRGSAQRVSSALELARRQLHEALTDASRAWPTLAVAEAEARDALKPLGLTLAAMRGHARPIVTLRQFEALAPAAFRRDLSAGVLSANAITVRKVEAAERRRSSVGGGRTPRYALDRADALLYLAENSGLPGRTMLLAGSRLLGPWLASSALFARAVDHESEEVRAGALGALILLGDLRAVTRACRRAEQRAAQSAYSRQSVEAARWWVGRLTTGD